MTISDHKSNKISIGMHRPYGIYEKNVKRPLDFLFSFMALLFLSPVLCVTALLIKSKLGTPIIFSQERPGKDGKAFRLYKFKTMLEPQTRQGRKLTDKERLKCIENGIEILSDEERLTDFGRFLRATSLDELPELWNIMRGDMSFVGPRPLSVIYLPYYNDYERHRHDVRPGLTGLAQIHGRNSISWDERFQYDLDYIKRITFWGDLHILLKTVKVVFDRKDIGQGDSRPEPFNLVRQREWKMKA